MTNDQSMPTWPGWETECLIGKGSFGAVYKIRRDIAGTLEYAAMKRITIPQSESELEEMRLSYDEESITNIYKNHLQNITSEYNLMRELKNSANIVHCDDIRCVQHDDGIGWDIYIRMELLTPLTKYLQQKPTEEIVLPLARDMCAALVCCEKRDIVHRDIKPQNIFVSEDGSYKLGDFGIAKTMEKTTGGTKTGTYSYMAPEVYNNKPYGQKADIYSLGLVLYWLLNERRMPFVPLPPAKLSVSIDSDARLRRFLGEALPPPAHGSAVMKAITLKACAYDPEDRFDSAADMLSVLRVLEERGEAAAQEFLKATDPVRRKRERQERLAREEAERLRRERERQERLAREEAERLRRERERQERLAREEAERLRREQEEKERLRREQEEEERLRREQEEAERLRQEREEKANQTTHKSKLLMIIAAVLAVVLLLVLNGRGTNGQEDPDNKSDTTENQTSSCAHQWAQATCTQPQSCILCGYTYGTTLGHQWQAATESQPKTCLLCGLTEGEPLPSKEEQLKENALRTARDYASQGQYRLAIKTIYDARREYDCEEFEQFIVEVQQKYSTHTLAASRYYSAKIRSDGTVALIGFSNDEQCSTDGWYDVVSVSLGDRHVVSLRGNGTVWVDGPSAYHSGVSGWSDITVVAAGDASTVGLRSDGTILAAGENDEGQCNVGSLYRESPIVSIAVGYKHTVVLYADGRVAAIGSNSKKQCNVTGWTNIVAIAAGPYCTMGLRADGTVVSTSYSVGGWVDIAAISVGEYHAVGLCANGTVVAVGRNEEGQCNTAGFSDVVEIAAGGVQTLGLRSDGALEAVVGSNKRGLEDVHLLYG